MKVPGRKEDTRNVTFIVGCGLVGLAVTAGGLGLLANTSRANAEAPYVVRVSPSPTRSALPARPASFEGTGLLYGTVVSRSGRDYTGYIRWDRNEGSWADLLDATKTDEWGDSGRLAGVRFGHVQRIEAIDGHSALVTLRSGDGVTMVGQSSDLGNGLRALQVELADGQIAEFEWRDLDYVDFEPAPAGMRASRERLYGTMTTRSGMEFTGYVAWDVDEIYSSDILDGEDDGRDLKIAFSDIETIERNGSSSARVLLRSGEELVLRGTNDVDDDNRGISVSDPDLGQVLVEWDDFESVRFLQGAQVEASRFDGGSALRGTVITQSGEEYSGELRWDADEQSGWEMLNGESEGVEFDVEFSKISRIERSARGALVELRDGRSFELSGSNDVNDGNGGIVISDGDDAIHVRWRDFREVRFQN